MAKNDKAGGLIILGGACLGISVITLILPRISQPQGYYDFADKATKFGIPNFLNVASNLPLFFVGLVGMMEMKRRIAYDHRFLLQATFISTMLTGIGSAFFHLEPNHTTLLFDRLPMSILFVAIACFTLAERVDARIGRLAFPPMALLSTTSNFYWLYSEKMGAGDLRYYALVQILCVLINVLCLLMYPRKYSCTHYWYAILGFFGLAKFCEFSDKLVYYAMFTMIGGHPLKHIFAAVSLCFLLKYVKVRKPLAARD